MMEKFLMHSTYLHIYGCGFIDCSSIMEQWQKEDKIYSQIKMLHVDILYISLYTFIYHPSTLQSLRSKLDIEASKTNKINWRNIVKSFSYFSERLGLIGRGVREGISEKCHRMKRYTVTLDPMDPEMPNTFYPQI